MATTGIDRATKQCTWCKRVWCDARETWTRFYRRPAGGVVQGLCPDCFQALMRAHGAGTPKLARRG